jgi:hypothetical protein
MELGDAETVDQLLGRDAGPYTRCSWCPFSEEGTDDMTDDERPPCENCVASQRLVAWAVVLGLGIGLSLGAILTGALRSTRTDG